MKMCTAKTACRSFPSLYSEALMKLSFVFTSAFNMHRFSRFYFSSNCVQLLNITSTTFSNFLKICFVIKNLNFEQICFHFGRVFLLSLGEGTYQEAKWRLSESHSIFSKLVYRQIHTVCRGCKCVCRHGFVIKNLGYDSYSLDNIDLIHIHCSTSICYEPLQFFFTIPGDAWNESDIKTLFKFIWKVYSKKIKLSLAIAISKPEVAKRQNARLQHFFYFPLFIVWWEHFLRGS